MLKTYIGTLLLGSTLLLAQAPQNIIDIGNKVSHTLMKKLSSKLKHELQNNGVVVATKFCNENAYTLTEEVNLQQVKGISVKRISLKYRNPANIPNAQEKGILESMQALLDNKELPPYLITHDGNKYTYYKPLVIKKQACLKCHGDISKDEDLSSFIKENYPLDKAVNYKLNDLRGAIVVEIKQ